MKKLLLVLSVSTVLYSCKTSSNGHCDAYGSVDKKEKSERINS